MCVANLFFLLRACAGKLTVLILVKPRALDVEKLEAGYADRKRQRIDRELRNRLVRARIRFVIEDVDGVISNLQKVEVARDRARRPTRRKLNPVSRFEFGDLVGVAPLNVENERQALLALSR